MHPGCDRAGTGTWQGVTEAWKVGDEVGEPALPDSGRSVCDAVGFGLCHLLFHSFMTMFVDLFNYFSSVC